MHRNKNSSGHRKKFRLLLDSAFAKPSSFPKLNKKANMVHTVHDLGLSYQAEDEEIYQKAVLGNRMIITVNFKDFKKLVKAEKPGIIGIESQMTNAQIDEKISKFISGKDPVDFIGKAVKI